MAKFMNETFKDYQQENNLKLAEIKELKLHKKENALQLDLISDKPIQLIDMITFEDYAIKKFNINFTLFNIEYRALEIDENISSIWKSLVTYIGRKEPLISSILNGSKINIDGNKVTVSIVSKLKYMLEAKKMNMFFQRIFKNLYNKQFIVNFECANNEAFEEKYSNMQKLQEKVIIEEIQKANEEKAKYLEAHPELRNQASNSGEGGKGGFTPRAKLNVITTENAEEKQLDEIKKVKGEETPLIYGRNLKTTSEYYKIVNIPNINPGDELKVLLEGEILSPEMISGRKQNDIVSFNIFDGSSTITCKFFPKKDDSEEIFKKLKKAKAVRVEGGARFDEFAKEVTVIAKTVIDVPPLPKEKRMDDAEEKRVELHLHTKMSQMDAVTSCEDLVKRAISWGWKAMAITDHGVVQSFPEAHKYLEKTKADIKILYGVEGYFVPPKDPCVFNSKHQEIDTEYCVLDLETTGISHFTEKITEVGIIKIKNGEVIDTFETFVNPEKPIPEEVVEITHITDDMVKDAETIDKIIPKIIEFIGDSVLVAHNADFDIGYLKYNFEKYGYKLENSYIDTLRLSKAVFPELKKYKLGVIAASLNIQVDVAHRALDDVKTLVAVFNRIIDRAKEREATTIDDFDNKFEMDFKKLPSYHIIILAKDYVGLKNLYKLVSYSHLDYFYKKPRILKSMLDEHREGLIVGSACSEGELYRAIMSGKSDEEIEEVASYYDYLEIQPLGNNDYMIRNGEVESKDSLAEINKRILALADKLGKLTVATGDVHFMDPQDEVYRRILEAGQGYKDADMQAPLYLRTTEEMLKEFEYLGDRAYEVVVTNTNKIADMCEKIRPISPEKCPPHIEGCEQTIKDIAYNKAHELYGEILPEIVQKRLDKELDSIINNGFSVMYIIAQKLVWKSNEDGYLVGSRGSVGSSLVAYMTGITEVNSLQPHYRCPNCKFSDFTDYGVKNGFDLPDKECPKCGSKFAKDGMDIPFETFLGFNGDKEPDIDLNFSGEYQGFAHRYTEVIFGKGTTFKAGTIGTIADKTAFGYVKNYFEERGKQVSTAEIERLSVGCTGIKRTTGQHPGGIIVVPKGREIFEFCPVQHPADDPDSDIITTHFDYHSIDQNLLKLDILGHDDPTIIRMLQDLTGVDPKTIPLDDKETMSIFSSTDALGVTPEQIGSEVGTYGVPEFGTKFSRGMLLDTKPTTFEELIRLSGLSHGTDVWLGNAQDLINQGIATLSEAVCTRDDIMVYLMKCGLEPNSAFKIMEVVRKGKATKDPEKWKEYEAMMREHDVPEWYMESCKKIKYMFPKAHAAAYVMMAFRIAWFKVHIPKAYYSAYFSIRAKQFDYEIMCFGKERVKAKMKEIENEGNQAQNKDKEMYPVLELVLEMYERGIKFLDVDLYKSHSTKFLVEEDGIRPPLNSIPGLGEVAAEGIYKTVQEDTFDCIDELQEKSHAGKVVMELLSRFGCLKGLPQSNQMSLFEM